MPVLVPDSVIADPLATAPRLRHAQALAGSDPAFSAYVPRAVAALAHARRFGPAGTDVERVALHRIAFAHQSSWFPNPPGTRLALGRGYPESLGRVPLDLWLAEGPALRRRYPLLELHTFGAAGRCAALGPTLGGIRALTLVGAGLVDADVRALFDHPAARDLVWLDLSGNQLGFESLRTLAANAPALRWLGFAGNAIPDPTAQWEDAGGLVATAEGGAEEAIDQLGPLPWLGPPPYRSVTQDPAWYYPIPDLP